MFEVNKCRAGHHALSLSFDLTLGPGLVFALNFLSDFRAPFRIEAP